MALAFASASALGAMPVLASVRPTRAAMSAPRVAAAKPLARGLTSGAARFAAAPVAGKARAPVRPAREFAGVVRAQAAEAAAPEEDDKSGLAATLLLGVLFAGWYAFNIGFNIFNKQVLKAYAFPITCTCLQFVVGSILAGTMWLTGIKKAPKLDKEILLKIAPLACVHTLGNLLTNVSLGMVAVSFTHTIKAMEPFFSVVLSAIFLGDAPTAGVLLTLIPIVGGVAAASMSEASFNWAGFISAMGSNLTFQSRNVLSKKIMGGNKVMDNINLFSIITMMSSVICFPIMLAFEGFTFTPGIMTEMGVANVSEIIKKAVFAGFFFHAYQQVSYMILERVSPVTHSIGNCVKRVIVIVSSVVFFQNTMTTQSQISTAVALAGVFAYSQVKRLAGKKEKAAAAAAKEA